VAQLPLKGLKRESKGLFNVEKSARLKGTLVLSYIVNEKERERLYIE
jgi:hypothetical protein